MSKFIRCQGCGVEKDTTTYEVYPYPDEERFGNDPMPPLLDVDTDLPDGKGSSRWALVCHRCYSRLDPDMWIDKKTWDAISPVTRYEDIPNERC